MNKPSVHKENSSLCPGTSANPKETSWYCSVEYFPTCLRGVRGARGVRGVQGGGADPYFEVEMCYV